MPKNVKDMAQRESMRRMSDTIRRVADMETKEYQAVGAAIDDATEKTTLTGADKFGIINSVGSVLAWISWTNILTALSALYVLLAGKAGGQSVHGGTAANEDLTLRGTSHATKTTSYVLIQPDGGLVAIGPVTPNRKLHVSSNLADFLASVRVQNTHTTGLASVFVENNAGSLFQFVAWGDTFAGTVLGETRAGIGSLEWTGAGNLVMGIAHAADFIFATNDLERGRFTSAGGFQVEGISSIKAGSSTAYAKEGGVIFDHFADSSVGGAETDIYTDTTPASSLAVNGDKITADYGGTFVLTTSEIVQLKAYFAGTMIWDSGAASTTIVGTTYWRINIKLIRVSSTVVRYTVNFNANVGFTGSVTVVAGELTGLTLSNTNILKITGASTGTGSGAGDIVGKMGSVSWFSAA